MIIKFPHNIEFYIVLCVLVFLAISVRMLRKWYELELQFINENLELFSMSVMRLTIIGLVLDKK